MATTVKLKEETEQGIVEIKEPSGEVYMLNYM
jgi:hypothetical protein